MIARYRTPHPNYVHLLFVTPSKHLHVLKDGRLKWQDKPMEVKLREISSSDREHVVYFLLAITAVQRFTQRFIHAVDFQPPRIFCSGLGGERKITSSMVCPT